MLLVLSLIHLAIVLCLSMQTALLEQEMGLEEVTACCMAATLASEERLRDLIADRVDDGAAELFDK